VAHYAPHYTQGSWARRCKQPIPEIHYPTDLAHMMQQFKINQLGGHINMQTE
jgi:hypothetical protein